MYEGVGIRLVALDRVLCIDGPNRKIITLGSPRHYRAEATPVPRLLSEAVGWRGVG